MKNLVNQYVEIWNTKNVKKLPDVFSETAAYIDATQNGNAIEVLTNSIRSTFEAFPDVSFKTISFLADSSSDKCCVLEWMMTGTNTGSFSGATSTNRKIEISGVDLIKIEEGKIVNIKSFYDSSLFANQLGL